MEILSSADGSAQAVRDAAVADGGSDARIALERELDRLNAALTAHAQAAVQHANWTLLAQAFLVTSYFIVLVVGWTVPLPGKRWLLAAIAGYALLSLLFGSLIQRGTRDRIASGVAGTVRAIEAPETDADLAATATGDAAAAGEVRATDAVDATVESTLKGEVAGSINSTVQDDIRDSIQADLVEDVTRSLPLPGRN